MKKLVTLMPLVAVVLMLVVSGDAHAEEAAAAAKTHLGAGLAMGLGALGGTLGQGMAARASYESISRNPAAADKLSTPFFVGMAFIESLVLFSLVVALTLAVV